MDRGAPDIQNSDYFIRHNKIMWRRIKRCQKFLNGIILLAIVSLFMMQAKKVRWPTFITANVEEQHLHSTKPTKGKHELKGSSKKFNIKVPWRFQLEDDGFVFPKRHSREKFIVYMPVPLTWPKQLQQFENALVFAYLLERTLLVPPLIESRNEVKNLTSRRHFAISTIIDFEQLSKVVSLREMTLKAIEHVANSSDIYKICHDHRLGFWVDFIPAVQDIQLWRMMRAQRFTAFPIRLDDIDLMCPATIQYGNRWGPPMKIKPIVRAIVTELYEREEDVLLFQGDTLSTRDFRFFDKKRTKTMQKILIFNVQFSRNVNLLMMQLMKYLGRKYNAILAGPIDERLTFRDELESRLRMKKFLDTSRTLLVVSRRSDEKEFKFLKDLGYHLVFESEITQNIDISGDRRILNDLHQLCVTVLCAYATKLITIAGSPEEYFVQHLRLQNVSMKDGLVMDNINVRWAKHTQLPAKDERVLLARRNVSNHAIAHNVTTTGINSTHPNMKNLTVNASDIAFNTMKTANKTFEVSLKNDTMKLPLTKTKPGSKLDVMVCTFCLYVKRITGKHGCPTIAQWCH